jgi:hypothetical protein
MNPCFLLSGKNYTGSNLTHFSAISRTSYKPPSTKKIEPLPFDQHSPLTACLTSNAPRCLTLLTALPTTILPYALAHPSSYLLSDLAPLRHALFPLTYALSAGHLDLFTQLIDSSMCLRPEHIKYLMDEVLAAGGNA